MKIPQYETRVDPQDRSIIPHAQAEDYGGLMHVVNRGFELLARGGQIAGNALTAQQDEEGKAWAAQNLSDARLKWTQEVSDRSANAQPGAPNFTPTLLEDYDKYANDLVSKAPSLNARRYMEERLGVFRSEMGSHAIAFEAQARIDQRSDQFNAAVDNTAKLMNSDPTQYGTAMAERLSEIDAANIPPVKKSALREGAINKISGAAVYSQIQKSPELFLQSIGYRGEETMPDGKIRKTNVDLQGKTGNLAFDAMPFDKRVQAFESAIKLKAQMDTDMDRSATVMRKQISDEAMKGAYALLYQNKLTPDIIESIRTVIDHNEYKSLLEATRKNPFDRQSNDPGAYRQLERLTYSNPAAAEKFAFQAHQAGQLTNETLGSGLARIREISRQEGPKSEYERSRAFIVNAMDPGPMVQDPVGKTRFAEAMDTFDRWYKAAPNRTDEDVQKRAKEVVGQYKFIDFSDTVLSLPMPRSGHIRRNTSDPAGMTEDIGKAGVEAQSRYKAGSITLKEYEDEMAVINRWRKAVAGVGYGK